MSCFSWWQVVVRLSDWGSAMEHDESGQVGNQAALSRSFLVPDSIPAGDFLCPLFFARFFYQRRFG